MAAIKLDDETLDRKLSELPTLPNIVYELTRVINDPMSSTADVEKIMANDPSLTTKVLKLANSAYYAIPGGVSNLSRAIAYLGYDTVYQLVLSTSIIKSLKVESSGIFEVKEFWKHSLGVAIAAETIGIETKHPMTSDLFTCGLIHDMGKIAMLIIAPEVMEQVLEKVDELKCDFYKAENELELHNHCFIGLKLAEKWNLPVIMRTTIRYHHKKSPFERVGVTADLNRNVDIIYLANILTHALKFGASGHEVIEGAPRELLERLAISTDSGFKNLLRQIKSQMEQAGDFLKVLEGNN